MVRLANATDKSHRKADDPSDTAQRTPALLVGRVEAARLCGISPASWDRLAIAEGTPAPIKLGGRVLWRRSDLESWIGHGCPNRKEFESLKSDE
jgi:predicted DNA-binding transcriptional regulator AlpA